MEFLNWAAEHWIFSLIATVILIGGAESILRALRGKR